MASQSLEFMEPIKKKKFKAGKSAPQKNGEVAELELKLKELTEALQRERADAQNLARRSAEEKLKLSGYYKAEVIREFLPVLDAAQKALEIAKNGKLGKEAAKETEGMVAVLNKFSKTLENLGLEKIRAEGEKFDENLHEAISVDESDGEGEEGVVTKEMQPGYKLGDEVLRHSMVVVRR
jgi:molecular chaperone GrpE